MTNPWKAGARCRRWLAPQGTGHTVECGTSAANCSSRDFHRGENAMRYCEACQFLATPFVPPLEVECEDAHGLHAWQSVGCVARRDEVPALRRRLARLARVSEAQLQPLKISRYDRGQRFAEHCDAIDGNGLVDEQSDYYADGPRVARGARRWPALRRV